MSAISVTVHNKFQQRPRLLVFTLVLHRRLSVTLVFALIRCETGRSVLNFGVNLWC